MNINNLRAEIARAGLTITGFAQAIGMDKAKLYRRLRGEKPFDSGEIMIIAQVLGLDEDAIMSIFFSDLVAENATKARKEARA